MKEMIQRFIREEDGLETVEYAVMTALIIGGLVIVVGLLGEAVAGRFSATTDEIAVPE